MFYFIFSSFFSLVEKFSALDTPPKLFGKIIIIIFFFTRRKEEDKVKFLAIRGHEETHLVRRCGFDWQVKTLGETNLQR